MLQIDNEDADVWQMEHVYRYTAPGFDRRLYLAGFIDHTFNQDIPDSVPSSPVVAEVQLGYRVIDHLYLVSEYRVNEYRRANVNNLAVGMEYKIIW